MHSPSVLILKADRLHSDLLLQIVSSVLPKARCVAVNQLKQAEAQLRMATVDFLLIGIDPSDGDAINLLVECTREPHSIRNIFVITSRREPRILASLRELPIRGAFDSGVEGIERLGPALRLVHAGGIYWSKSFLRCMQRDQRVSCSACALLTRAQERVFAVIGDGCDDTTAGDRLGLRPSTVSSIRREIHRKLNVHHRGELMRTALLSGYVCFASGQIVHPAFSLLPGGRRTQ